MRPRGLYDVYCPVCFFFTLYICLCLIILLTIPSKRWETIVHSESFTRMWISPSPGAYSMWNFCFLSILADFTSANEDFLRKSARSCSLNQTHTHMDVLNHTAVVGRKYAASFGGYNVGKERKQQKIVALLLGSSSRHKKWAIDLSYFDKTKHLFLHLPPLLVVVYFFSNQYTF